MTSATTDARAVDLALKGRPDAYRVLFDLYAGPVRRAVRRIVQDDDAAGELTQQAFVAAWENLGSYDPEHRFFSWVYRIAVNRALNAVRDGRCLRPLGDDDPPSPGLDPEQDLLRREQQDRLDAALAALPVKYRLLLALRYELDLPGAAIARIQGLTPATVKSRLHTALALLRTDLQRAERPTWARSPGPPSRRPGRSSPAPAAARGGRPPTPRAR